MRLLALDRNLLSSSRDSDGRLRWSAARISKASVSPYRGDEIVGWKELGLDAKRTYRLLRHPDELRRAAASFNGLPLLSAHVGFDEPRPDLVIGCCGSKAGFGGTYLTNDLHIWSEAAIDAVESGERRELSCGYHYRPVMTPGIFRGARYDGVMTDIAGHHCALVPEGRVGVGVNLNEGGYRDGEGAAA